MINYKLFINYLYILTFLVYFSNALTVYYYGDDKQFSIDRITYNDNKILSYNDILWYLFKTIDQNGDMFLDYREMAIYQYYTEPSIQLTFDLFKEICKLLNVNRILHYPVGLDINMFNASYTIYKNELGTNIYRDFTKILKLQNIM